MRIRISQSADLPDIERRLGLAYGLSKRGAKAWTMAAVLARGMANPDSEAFLSLFAGLEDLKERVDYVRPSLWLRESLVLLAAKSPGKARNVWREFMGWAVGDLKEGLASHFLTADLSALALEVREHYARILHGGKTTAKTYDDLKGRAHTLWLSYGAEKDEPSAHVARALMMSIAALCNPASAGGFVYQSCEANATVVVGRHLDSLKDAEDRENWTFAFQVSASRQASKLIELMLWEAESAR